MEKINQFGNNENLSDPRPFIMAVIGEISPLGANDYEISELYRIITDFEDNKISASEAYNQASGIKDNKLRGDYH